MFDIRAVFFVIAVAVCAMANANLFLLSRNDDVLNVVYRSALTAIVGG